MGTKRGIIPFDYPDLTDFFSDGFSWTYEGNMGGWSCEVYYGFSLVKSPD